ncbi:MAG: DUF6926 domain-containing protein [Ilumatobacteraceae bacterium]
MSDFKINEHLLPYIINGECDTITDEERDDVESFLTENDIEVVEPLYNGEDLDKSFAQCDITGAWCMAVQVLCYKYRNFKWQRI